MLLYDGLEPIHDGKKNSLLIWFQQQAELFECSERHFGCNTVI